jgi:hypothetical protein
MQSECLFVCVFCPSTLLCARPLFVPIVILFRVWGNAALVLCGVRFSFSCISMSLLERDLRKKHGSCSRENSVLLLSVLLRMELVGSKFVQEDKRNRWKLLVHAFLLRQGGALSICWLWCLHCLGFGPGHIVWRMYVLGHEDDVQMLRRSLSWMFWCRSQGQQPCLQLGGKSRRRRAKSLTSLRSLLLRCVYYADQEILHLLGIGVLWMEKLEFRQLLLLLQVILL